MLMSRRVQPSPVVEAGRVDHQRISVPSAHRRAQPRRLRIDGKLAAGGYIHKWARPVGTYYITDTYTWHACTGCVGGGPADSYYFEIDDQTAGIGTGQQIVPILGGFVNEYGAVTFSPVNTAVPEPNSVALLLTAIGFMFVMLKRWDRTGVLK
jgi:hypothetical protein